MFSEKIQNWHHCGPTKLQNAINEIQLVVIFVIQKVFLNEREEKPTRVDYPMRFINSVINEFKKSKDHGDENL